MNASNHLITQVLDHFSGNGTFTTPPTLYLALLKTAATHYGISFDKLYNMKLRTQALDILIAGPLRTA